MPAYNVFSAVKPDNTEIQVYGDGSVNIEIFDANGNGNDVDLTLKQLKKLVKEAEQRNALFNN